MRNLISCEQYSKETLDELYNLADRLKNNPAEFSDALKGKVVAALFFEPSTRTRLSFEAAALRLGGGVIGTENGKADSSAAKGETLEDTVRVVCGYCDAIVLRHNDDDSAERAAAVSCVPIINAGAGKGEHPTQALLDLYTIRARRGGLNGLKAAVLGDLKYGRTVHSLLKLLALYDGVTVYGLSKKQFSLPTEYIEFLKSKNIDYIVCQDFNDIPKDVDVLYHTRIQSERFDENFGKEKFIINKKTLGTFSDKTMVLHPLPRNIEISADIDGDPRALYFEQAHNGLYVRMALLITLMLYCSPD